MKADVSTDVTHGLIFKSAIFRETPHGQMGEIVTSIPVGDRSWLKILERRLIFSRKTRQGFVGGFIVVVHGDSFARVGQGRLVGWVPSSSKSILAKRGAIETEPADLSRFRPRGKRLLHRLSEADHAGDRRLSEFPAVFAAELGRTFVADIIG